MRAALGDTATVRVDEAAIDCECEEVKVRVAVMSLDPEEVSGGEAVTGRGRVSERLIASVEDGVAEKVATGVPVRGGLTLRDSDA